MSTIFINTTAKPQVKRLREDSEMTPIKEKSFLPSYYLGLKAPYSARRKNKISKLSRDKTMHLVRYFTDLNRVNSVQRFEVSWKFQKILDSVFLHFFSSKLEYNNFFLILINADTLQGVKKSLFNADVITRGGHILTSLALASSPRKLPCPRLKDSTFF